MPAEADDVLESPGAGLASPDISELVLLDAVELSWLIARREVSCVEVAEAFLDHIDRFNPRVNAIVSRAPREQVLDEARQRDRELDRGEHRGWMHGFPIAVKDLADAAGFPTTKGSPLLADQTASSDELFVRRMRESGAVVLGKTNVPEFGLGSHTFNDVFGTTTNPYDPSRSAGGSSGGAAAALALRMLPVSDGSDFMGSLRNPAAFCNVLGLRPTYGRVPSEGFLSEPAVNGPMGRTARDTAMLLSTMAGPHERCPLGVEQDPAVFAGSLERDLTGVRIGWVGDFDGYLPTEPGVLDLCASTFEVFEQLGCTVEPAGAQLPVERAWRTFLLWRHWMLSRSLGELGPEALDQIKPEAAFELDGARSLTAADVNAALDGREAWRAHVSELFETYDFLLAPTAQVFPFDAALRWPAEIDGRRMDTYHRWMEVVVPWTLSGHPVLNLPAGFGPGGLPTGVQLIGRGHDEFGLLQVAHGYEQASDWVHRVLAPCLR